MSFDRKSTRASAATKKTQDLDRRFAAYVIASASAGSLVASEAQAVVVSDTTVRPFGVNEHVDVDFNSDGQIDFQIDHDRVNLDGTNLDYLQLDKNDISSAADPYPVDAFAVFPVPDGQSRNWDHQYLTVPEIEGDLGYYPAAFLSGAEIGPLGNWDFQEGDNFLGQGTTIRANRLIDEDATQIDADAGANTQLPYGTPGWLGLGGQTRYLGVRIDLNDVGYPDNAFPTVNGPNNTNDPANYFYGWIGVRITNEADATGEVVGWGYETELGTSILAGETAPGLQGDYNGDGKVDAADYVVWRKNDGTLAGFNTWRGNFGAMMGSGGSVGAGAGGQAVPEPSSLVLTIAVGLAMICAFVCRRFRRS
jgi:hypothetical protein